MLRSVDVSTSKHSLNTDHISEKRLISFKELKHIDPDCVCSSEWRRCDIEVIQRIGSPSMNGEVYQLKYRGKEFVGKILPIIDKKTEESSSSEIKIANFVSNLVTTGQSVYFPVVYGSAFCREVIYNEKSLFSKPSKLHALKKHIEKQMSSNIQKKRFSTSANTLKKAKAFASENKINIDNISPSSYIMFSEIAYSDLSYYIEQYTLTVKEWNALITHIFLAIKTMQDKNLFHGDLHTGNILILKNENNDLLPLIHDFGTSYFVEDWTIGERKEDLEKFLYQLMKNQNIPDTIMKKLENINDYVSSFNDTSSLIDIVIEMWSA